MSESVPRFSVVIAAYNAEATLGETLDSVARQTWSDYEVVVADDGSSDRTPEIVRARAREDSRVRLVASAANSGRPACPRNLGMRESRGDFLAFLDADDLWEPEKLAHDAAFLEREPADFVYSGCRYFVGAPENVVAHVDPPAVGDWVLFRNLIQFQTVCVDRRVCVEHGLGFDESPELRAIEDYHFVLEAYLGGLRMARRPGADVLYRKGSPTSIYPRHDLRRLLARHVSNLRRIRQKYPLSRARYLGALGLTLAYKSAQAALGRA